MKHSFFHVDLKLIKKRSKNKFKSFLYLTVLLRLRSVCCLFIVPDFRWDFTYYNKVPFHCVPKERHSFNISINGSLLIDRQAPNAQVSNKITFDKTTKKRVVSFNKLSNIISSLFFQSTKHSSET